MIYRSFLISCSLASVAAVCSPAPVFAQSPEVFESNRYESRSGIEFANGYSTHSETKRTRVVRQRRGSESLTTYNVLDGAVVSENINGTLAMPMAAPSSDVVDAAYRYDYDTKTLHGPESFSAYFNQYIRPNLPDAEKGEPGQWTVDLTLSELGFDSHGNAAVSVTVERSFSEYNGDRYGLISFDIPAFEYELETGEHLVHWARGAAISDEHFGIVYYLVARHRGVANAGTDSQRPMSVKLYNYATDSEGEPLLDLNEFAAGNLLIQNAAVGMQANPFPLLQMPHEGEMDRVLDRGFFQVSNVMTPLAFSIGEQGANQTGTGSAETQTTTQAQYDAVSKAFRAGMYTDNLGLQKHISELPEVKRMAELYKTTSDIKAQISALQAVPVGSEHFLNQLTNGRWTTRELIREMDAARAAGNMPRAEYLNGFKAQAIDMAVEAIIENNQKISALRNLIPTDVDMLTAENAMKRATQLAIENNADGTTKLLRTLGIIGSIANTAKTGSLLYDTFLGEEQQYDDATHEYLEAGGSRLAWQLADIGLSTATGDAYNLAVSGIGITAQSARDVRLAYYGELEADYQLASARADARLTYHRYIANIKQGFRDEIDSAQGDLDELRGIFERLERLESQEALINELDAPPPPPPPTMEELITGLSNALDANAPRYPTVTEEQKRAIRQQALARQNSNDNGAVSTLDDDFWSTFDSAFLGDFGDAGDVPELARMGLLGGLIGDDGYDPLTDLFGGSNLDDLFFGSDEFSQSDLAIMALDQAGADTTPQAVSDQVPSMSISEFANNNAFDYNNMSGIVPTDLSKYQEWLATQDIRRLEKLALQAGYPNLASALADADNLIRQSQDSGYRTWANQAPSCSGYVGCGPSYLERWGMKRSVVALGDVLADSRAVFSTGGLSDIGISGLNLIYALADFGVEDGDAVSVQITQFGRVVAELNGIVLSNSGSTFNAQLRPGVAQLVITALNEGDISPNTAALTVQNVVRGSGGQEYSLGAGETAVLRIEANASPSSGEASSKSSNEIVGSTEPAQPISGSAPAMVRPKLAPDRVSDPTTGPVAPLAQAASAGFPIEPHTLRPLQRSKLNRAPD